MIIRGPIIPSELGAEKGRPVAAYYGYLNSLFLINDTVLKQRSLACLKSSIVGSPESNLESKSKTFSVLAFGPFFWNLALEAFVKL